MNPVTPVPVPGGGSGTVKGVAKKWTVKGVDKQPDKQPVAKTAPPKMVKTAAAPEADGEQRGKTAPPPTSPVAEPEKVAVAKVAKVRQRLMLTESREARRRLRPHRPWLHRARLRGR
jgi:hypothetical protein